MGEYLPISLQDGAGDVQAGQFGYGKQEDSARKPSQHDSSENQNIRVDYQTEGKYYRLGLSDRDLLMILSTRREVNVLVSLPADSSPRTPSTTHVWVGNLWVYWTADTALPWS